MISLFKVHMPKSVMAPIEQVLMSGYIGQGAKVEEFEEKLSKWMDRKNIVTVNSCTSAIHLALRLADVNVGDEVISTPMTCTATNSPPMERGAKIVWADVNSVGNISPEDIKKKITKKTKAIIVVHNGGYPCDMNEIADIVKGTNIKVIEDAAHAFGSKYQGKFIGSHSDFVCFSFQAIKQLTTGDGGALAIKNDNDYDRAKLLRWYGLDREKSASYRCSQSIEEYGYKFHMNDINATIGLEQLKYIEEIIQKHRANAQYYDEHLQSLGNVKLLHYKKDRASAYWLYYVMVDDKDYFTRFMLENGVAVSSVHRRNDEQPMFAEFKTPLSELDKYSKSAIAIPVGWWLSEKDLSHICTSIKEYDTQNL